MALNNIKDKCAEKQFSSFRHKIHKKVQLSDLELREGGGRAFFGCPAGFFVEQKSQQDNLLQFLIQKKGAKASCTPVR